MARTKKEKTEAQFARFFQPILDALRALGGSGRPPEVKDWILENVALPEEFLAKVNKTGETKFSNQVDWARFYLSRFGYLDSSLRGVWSLTESGRTAEISNQQAV
jgi:restriction endonuclease Mrr